MLQITNYNLPNYLALLLVITLISSSCKTQKDMEEVKSQDAMIIANLEDGKSNNFKLINEAFESNNPGYKLDYTHHSNKINSSESNRVVFIQQGGGTASINESSSKFSVGDIILLKKDLSLTADSTFSALLITVPDEIPSSLPDFIRPDWDEMITDTPGGCATATNAYRRILLTWKNTVGPYVFHSVNAHRVRIMDSFSHYHPKIGGFDEFYLVQMAAPSARLITSSRVKEMEDNEQLTSKQALNLIESHSLKVGDLVYLPRGVMHRGVGNVLAQVITVPGFIPGAEIGVDHHLLRINKQLNLRADNAVPYNKEASTKAIIK